MMARGRWIKYQRVNPKILEILRRAGKPLTTNEIRTQLDQKHNIRQSWITLHGYLEQLEQGKHISCMLFEKTNKVRLWQIMRG